MTINEALTGIKSLQPNQYDDGLLLRWLSELDGRVWDECLKGYEDSPVCPQPRVSEANQAPEIGEADEARSPRPCRAGRGPQPYDAEGDMERELLIPFPHDDVYLKWLGARIDYHNGEFERYNNAMVMFNVEYQSFLASYNRAHMPRQTSLQGV